MRKHLIIAGLILALESWLGTGLFGGSVGIVCPIVFVILAFPRNSAGRSTSIWPLFMPCYSLQRLL